MYFFTLKFTPLMFNFSIYKFTPLVLYHTCLIFIKFSIISILYNFLLLLFYYFIIIIIIIIIIIFIC